MAAASAFVLTGCTESDLSGDTSLAKESAPSAIEFSAKTRNAGVTRAGTEQSATYTNGAIGNATDATNHITDLKNARFGVFGYYTQTKDYRAAYNDWGTGTWKKDDTNKYPNFMYNQELKYGTASSLEAWVYDPVKYWPNGTDAANASNTPSNTANENENVAKLSFFAYAPYMEEGTTATTTGSDIPTSVTAYDVKTPKTIDDDNDPGTDPVKNGIVAISKNTSPTDVWVKYVLPVAEEDKAVDLLWGIRGQKSYAETDGGNNMIANLEDNTYNTDLTKQTVGEKVVFLFKHALTKIGGVTSDGDESKDDQPLKCGFKVVVDIDKNSAAPTTEGQSAQTSYFGEDFTNTKTLVTLKEVKIQDTGSAATDANVKAVTSGSSDLLKSGWFDIESGLWNTTNAEKGARYNIVANNTAAADNNLNESPYSLNVKIKEIGAKKNAAGGDGKELESGNASWNASNNPAGVTLTPTDVFADENVPALMLIPDGANEQTLYITVTYVVRTADPKLNAGFSEVEQTITNKVSLANLKPNKYYTIIMHLGLTSVKFSAVVADWSLTDGTEYNENGSEISGNNDNKNVVWLPSNVVYAQTTASPYAASKNATSSVFTEAGTTSYEINVSGLTKDNKINVTHSGAATGATASPATITDAGATTVTVTMPANATVNTVNSYVTIKEYTDANSNDVLDEGDTVVSTTNVTIIQNPQP